MTVEQVHTNPDHLLVQLLERLEARDSGNGAAPLDRAGTRARILDAAISMFAAKGFEACTMRDLAAAVGIKAPGLYSHFSSKEAILSEAMIRALADFLTYIAAPSDASTPVERLEETVRRHVLYQLRNLNVTRANDLLLNSEAMGEFLPRPDHELLVGVQRTYYQLVRSRIEEVLAEQSPIDRRVVTFAVINMCDRVTTWYHPGGALQPEDIAVQYWQLVQGMLRI
jgi:AcrR family transcriptional regulator